MGTQNTKIALPSAHNHIRASLVHIQDFCPPFRTYASQYISPSSSSASTFTLTLSHPSQSKIIINQLCFQQMEEAFNGKTQNIQLNLVFFDTHYADRKIYIAENCQKEIAIQIRPFVKFNTQLFNNILYQLHINEKLTKINSRLLNTFTDYYAIETGLETAGEQYPCSQVLVMQPIAATLTDIIKYRRQNKWEWTNSQFNALAYDLSQAVLLLHNNDLTHNDIRPFNVYYSLNKGCYQLGGFSNATKKSEQTGSHNIRKAMHFQISSESPFRDDLEQNDIYALGMTLLCAFYLYEPLDYQSVREQILKHQQKYPVLKLIKKMIKKSQSPLSLQNLISHLNPEESSPKMKSFIHSLRYRNTPKDRNLIEFKKTISEGYQRLGLWNEWKQNLTDAFQLQEMELDDYKKACSLSQLAKIQSCRGDANNANQYAKRASKLFRKLGYIAYDQGNIDESISLFDKSIEVTKHFEDQDDIDLAKNLQGLALSHSQNGNYEVAKPLISQSLALIQRNCGKDSLDACKIQMSQAHIESDFGQFEQADRILSACLNIAQVHSKMNDQMGIRLKAQILHDYGKNLMLQASYNDQNQQKLLNQAYMAFSQAKMINQQIPDNQPAIISSIQAMGQVQMRKNSYLEARNTFRKAQAMRNHPEMDKERADNLCQIAACQTELGEYQLALKEYQQALVIYKKVFGTDHNKLSAITIGNMSKPYSKLSKKEKAKQCISIACQIIGDLSGTEDPDYQHFKMIQTTL